MPQLVRPGFVGKIAGLASAVAGGAAAITYLLRATFSGADTGAMANGADVETQSPGSVEDGSLTVLDTSTGTAEVLSNEYKISPTTTQSQTGAVSGSFTRSTGLVYKASCNKTAAGVLPGIGWETTAVGLRGGTSVAAVNYTSSDEVDLYIFNPAGTQVGGTWRSGITVAATTPTKFALVVADFDSSGIPSGSGDYGYALFIHNNTEWLFAGTSPYLNTATMYANIGCGGSGGTVTFDDLALPQTTYPELLTPTGYTLDTFVESSDTALASHTADSGQSWTALTGTFTVNAANNRVYCSSASGENVAKLADVSADVFISAKTTVPGSSSTYHGVAFRVVDGSNFWAVLTDGYSATPRTILREVVSGSGLDRVILSGTGAGPIQALCNGDTFRIKNLTAGNSGVRTSTVHQTATGVGVYSNGTGSGTVGVDYMRAVPISSSDYATALDAF